MLQLFFLHLKQYISHFTSVSFTLLSFFINHSFKIFRLNW